LLIDAQGYIQNIEVISEEPKNYGFADAAVNAIKKAVPKNQKVSPGKIGDQAVAVRYSFPFSFKNP
ncbi:MAG: energy transducer TonB, partial [Treponema sp.]|nr:energy transducer TonB [Treponema sp.]